MKTYNIDQLIYRGLHDSELLKFEIDYNEKRLILFTSDEEELKIVFDGISNLKIDMDDDFKNQEIILDFEFIAVSRIRVFTTSNTDYKFDFTECIAYVLEPK